MSSGKYLIWSGENFKDFGVNFSEIYSFEQALEKVKQVELTKQGFLDEIGEYPEIFLPKDEFETNSEFQKRKELFEIARDKFYKEYKENRKAKLLEIDEFIEDSKSDILNSYLGKQDIQMQYNPEIEEFKINLKSRVINLDFNIAVKRDIAKEFKERVKNFDFLCEHNEREKIQIGTKKVKVGSKKVKVGTEKIKFAIFFTRNEAIYKEEPIYKEKPLYKYKSIADDKKFLNIIEISTYFNKQTFKVNKLFSILDIEKQQKKNLENEILELVRYVEDGKCNEYESEKYESYVKTLEIILENNINILSIKILNSIATIDNIEWIYEAVSCQESDEYRTIDCSILRQLARQEIIRRENENSSN